MRLFSNILKGFGIALGVFTLFYVYDSLSYHYSLFYWMCVSVVSLPILALRTQKLKLYAGILAMIGGVLTISPMDFTFESGEFGIRILPTSHGIATKPGTIGYGCMVTSPPAVALVFSF